MKNVTHKRVLVAFLAFVAFISFYGRAWAADPNAGKAIAATCGACHGQSGISPNDEWPNLAGQKETYLKNQIRAFRDGTRTSALMAPMVKPLSDTDIENIAAYFASLKQP